MSTRAPRPAGGVPAKPARRETSAGVLVRTQLDILEDLERRQGSSADGFILGHTIARRHRRTSEALHKTAASLVARGLLEVGARDGWITYRLTDAGRDALA